VPGTAAGGWFEWEMWTGGRLPSRQRKRNGNALGRATRSLGPDGAKRRWFDPRRYVYALTDYREIDHSIALARIAA